MTDSGIVTGNDSEGRNGNVLAPSLSERVLEREYNDGSSTGSKQEFPFLDRPSGNAPGPIDDRRFPGGKSERGRDTAPHGDSVYCRPPS